MWRQSAAVSHGKIYGVAVDQPAIREAHVLVVAAKLEGVADAELLLQHGVQLAAYLPGSWQNYIRGIQPAKLIGCVRVAFH